MATPTRKSPELDVAIDKFVRNVFKDSMGRQDSIEANVCATCGSTAVTFTDDLSKHEYTISGMCQTCQDKAFS